MAAKKQASKKGKINLADGVSAAEASLAGATLQAAGARTHEYQAVPAPGAVAIKGQLVTLPDGRLAEIVQACSSRRDLDEYAAEHVYLACRIIAE